MENLVQAFTHINRAFSSTNHLSDRKIAFNPDVPPTEVVHVFNLDDVQSFFMAPIEVDELDPRLQSGAIRCPNLYVKPMTEKLSRQINDAIANSWRVDLYEDVKAAAPEESGLSHGLTQEESHWLKMLMKGPVLRSRARASEHAAYVTSLELSSAHLRDYVRRLPQPLTTKQFNQELDAFFGSESGTKGQDAEVEADALNDADDICLVEPNRTSPRKEIQMIAGDYNVSTSPFSLAVERNLAGHAAVGADEMNLEGTFELAQGSGLEEEDFRSRNEVQRQSNPAEAGSLQAPQAPHNESDMYDEEPEYEPPESFDILWPPYQDYTSGPFRFDNADTFLHTAPEAGTLAHQTGHSEFWQGGFEPAMFSLSNSDQPLDCVRTEGNIVPNIDVSADLQLEAELNASASEHKTESPGPYTKLLKFTNDDHSPTKLETHSPEVNTPELALGEPVFTGTKTKERPTFHRTRTPSPLKPTRPLAPLAPAPRTIPNPITTAFPIPIPLTTSTPDPLTRSHPCHSTCTGTPSPSHPTITRTNLSPLTPQSKTVKAVFASPKLRSGPPSPIKINNLDRETPTKAAKKQTHADSAHRATATAFDDVGTVHVQLSALGQGPGLGLGLGLGFEFGSAQTHPDSAIDVSFPAAAKAEDEARMVSVAVAEASTKAKMKTKAKAKATTATATATKESEMAMATTTVKRKVGRPRKVRPAVDDGSVGGEKVGAVAKSPVRKRARKGTRGPVGGGAA